MLRQAAKTDAIAGVVLRVDSGGGDALASDLMCGLLSGLALHPCAYLYRAVPGQN